MQEYLNLHPEVVRGTEIREEQEKEAKDRKQGKNKKEKPAIEVKEVWFRYEKESADVIRDLSFQVKKGRILCSCRWKRNRKKYNIVPALSYPGTLSWKNNTGWAGYPQIQ